MALNMEQSLVNIATAKGNARKPEQNAARNSRNEVVVMLVVVLRIYCVVARWGEEVKSAILTTKCGIKLYKVVTGGTKVTLCIIWGEVYLHYSVILGLPRSTPRTKVVSAVFKSFAAVATNFISVHCFLLHCKVDSNIWCISRCCIRYYIIFLPFC